MDCARMQYEVAYNELDPFPDPTFLNPVEDEQHEDIKAAVNNVSKEVHANGPPGKYWQHIDNLVCNHINVFIFIF